MLRAARVAVELFPAHAGVILFAIKDAGERQAFPRTCGGDGFLTLCALL